MWWGRGRVNGWWYLVVVVFWWSGGLICVLVVDYTVKFGNIAAGLNSESIVLGVVFVLLGVVRSAGCSSFWGVLFVLLCVVR